jgi:hypothetical protein
VAVDVSTVKALLTMDALAHLRAESFRFCPGADCETVYFSADGQIYGVTDVRVPVWQKLPAGQRTICYCFGENEADMRLELDQTGRCGVIERVRRHIGDRRCACDLRNPRGTCCLGDLAATVKRLMADQVPTP